MYFLHSDVPFLMFFPIIALKTRYLTKSSFEVVGKKKKVEFTLSAFFFPPSQPLFPSQHPLSSVK